MLVSKTVEMKMTYYYESTCIDILVQDVPTEKNAWKCHQI